TRQLRHLVEGHALRFAPAATEAGCRTGHAAHPSVLDQARIDDKVGTRAAQALVRAEIQRHACHVASVETEFQCLQFDELPVELGREPQLLLPLRQDRAGYDAVDPDARRPELASKGL